MKDFEPKFRVVSELQRLGERAFIHKLKNKRPDISDSEISAEIARWYLTKIDAAPEEGLVRRADLSGLRSQRN